MGSQKINVLLADAGRHRRPNGYGKVARSLIRVLGASPDIDLTVEKSGQPWSIDEQTRARLGSFRETALDHVSNESALVLQIGPPASCRKFAVPSLMYTFCDTTELPQADIVAMKRADGIIAPNNANFALYQRHFGDVSLVHPAIDEHSFKPQPKFRDEGDDRFTFYFVGSFSYRKGCDVLIDAFLSEFSPEEARLAMHVEPAQIDRAANYIFDAMDRMNRRGSFSLRGESVSEQWMSRFYSRTDCFVTCTRGEGWGLPMIEAMLCELPVISPFSTAMADYLTNDVALKIESSPVLIEDITNRFGDNFKTSHPAENNKIFEPSLASARHQMRSAYENRSTFRTMGGVGRRHIIDNFSERKFAENISRVVTTFAIASAK